jgi:pimeloyl-[acyl-carrier protein] methyl ester esterase
MSQIVLVHGWGYDASLWDAVRAQLKTDATTLDLGFYGAAPPATEGSPLYGTPTFAEPVIAVGHSLGALRWLTQAPDAWQRLLCINGFPRFTETADYAPAVAPRVLARMQQQFARDPAAVLADFHARCGGYAPTGTPNIERLAAGLGWLAQWDGRAALTARRADVFALASTHDPIVPAAMSAMGVGHVEMIDAPGHLLPLTHPELCAQWIERLAA